MKKTIFLLVAVLIILYVFLFINRKIDNCYINDSRIPKDLTEIENILNSTSAFKERKAFYYVIDSYCLNKDSLNIYYNGRDELNELKSIIKENKNIFNFTYSFTNI